MEMQSCRVREPLRHDGVDHAPGGVVTLDAPTAAPLVLAGVLAVMPAVEPPPGGKGAAGRRAAPARG